MSRDRQFRSTATVHEARGDAWRAERQRAGGIHSRSSHDVLPSDLYGKNGSRCDVGRERRASSLWDQQSPHRGRVRHAPRHHRQHHGSLRHHRRTRRRAAEGGAWTLTPTRRMLCRTNETTISRAYWPVYGAGQLPARSIGGDSLIWPWRPGSRRQSFPSLPIRVSRPKAPRQGSSGALTLLTTTSWSALVPLAA